MFKVTRLFIIAVICLPGVHASAQDNATERYLEVRGHTELDMKPLSRATINLYEGSSKVKTIQADAEGSFSLRLDMNKQYTIEVEKNGLVLCFIPSLV